MFGVAIETGPKQALSPESAAALDLFDQFVNAQTFKAVLGTFRLICETLRIKPTNLPNFYPKLKTKLRSWKAQALWAKFDKRASHKCYNRGKACANTRVLIIGAGPCGLRTAIEAQLLGAKVVVVEKRDRFSRNNVLHLWPFVIHDLRNLGAKKFYGKFCAGSIDHISIRQLQCFLLKAALLLGVEVHENVSFEDLIEPPLDQSREKIGWKATVSPKDHPVSDYEFDVLVGADGKRNTLKGFKRKEFRGKLAIAITANFINRHSEEEARVQEISGVAFIFNQKFFQDLHDATGIDLENIVYYKDETHYFVMTAKKYSLIEKGVILNDYADTARLLAADNVNRDALLEYAREAADFSTNFQMPHLEFAVNHYGQADVAMFDFTSMFAAESACRVVERRGHRLLQALVGDSLLEPFWPTGSGCARGFLSSLDTCWMIRSWSLGFMTPLQVLAERESVYRLLAQTTPENLSKDCNDYTLNPSSRYPNLNSNAVRPVQIKGLYDTDGELKDEPLEMPLPKKKRKRDSFVHPDTLLNWCQRQVILYKNVSIENMTISWKNGLALCAIIHRYRPDLIDFHSLKEEDAEKNIQLVFDICEREYGILPVMTAKELVESAVPDALAIMSYISQIYDTFRGEIPYVARAPLTDLSPDERPASPSRKSPVSRFSFLSRLGQRLGSKKRYSVEKMEKDRALDLHLQEQERENEIAEALKRAKKRRSLERDRALFILNKNSVTPTLTSYKKTEASLEDRENFVTRVKDLEEKLYGSGKKHFPSNANVPKVGKIDRGDWNVKMLEERLKGSKPPVKKDKEEVPKWSRDIFEDKLRTMDQKLRSDSPEELVKYSNFDLNLRMLDKKLKEGNNLETGQRGMNKVSAMAEHLSAALETKPPSLTLQRSNSKPTLAPQQQNASEMCHFCNKRVYLMERHSAHGKFFHRGCFKCECCGVSLRLGNYGIGTEPPYIGKFLCMHHFNMRIIPRKRPSSERESEPKKTARAKAAPLHFQTLQGSALEVPDSGFEKTRGVTPERVEFENSLELTSEEELLSEIDEDEFTERNFLNSASEFDSTDEESDFSSDEMADEAREELEEALHNSLSSDQTIKLAETWNRRHFKRRSSGGLEEEEDDEETDEDYGESGEEYSYEEYENEDDESTATEGEVQDGAGEGPSERVASSADELDKDGEVQLKVPRQADKPWERDDYHKLQSSEGTGTEEDTASKTSDSELYSETDTETESESQGDEEDEEKGDEGDEDSEDGNDYLPRHCRSKGKHKHFIPTIVIDEMTASAPNEDDDSYFTTLQEQSLQAERTLEDLIQEQLAESAIQSPETCLAFNVKEEICPLVSEPVPKPLEAALGEGDGLGATNFVEEMGRGIGEDKTNGVQLDVERQEIILPAGNVVNVDDHSKTCNDVHEEIVSHQSVTSHQPSDPAKGVEPDVQDDTDSTLPTQVQSVTSMSIGNQNGAHLSGKLTHEFLKSQKEDVDEASSGQLELAKTKISSPISETCSSPKLSSLPDVTKVRDDDKDRQMTTESPTAKMMLKLKERYLLGNVNVPETSSSLPEKSLQDGQSTKLEPVVKSFLEIISEKQKMLSPAPTPAVPSFHRPLGLSFSEFSPSSPTSLLSSSSPEPLNLKVGSSSSLSRFSPISPLSTASSTTCPSPFGDHKFSTSPGLDKEFSSQTILNSPITKKVDDHLPTELGVGPNVMIEKNDPEVSALETEAVVEKTLNESHGTELENGIEMGVNTEGHEDETILKEAECEIAVAACQEKTSSDDNCKSSNAIQLQSESQKLHEGDIDDMTNFSKDEQLRMDSEKDVHPATLSPPISSTIIEVYSESCPGEQLNNGTEDSKSNEVVSPTEEMEIEVTSLEEFAEDKKVLQQNENVTLAAENESEIQPSEDITEEHSVIQPDSAAACSNSIDSFEDTPLDASQFDSIDTKFITFRDKSGKAEVDVSDIIIAYTTWLESGLVVSDTQEMLPSGLNVASEILPSELTVPSETLVCSVPEANTEDYPKDGQDAPKLEDTGEAEISEDLEALVVPSALTDEVCSSVQENLVVQGEITDVAAKNDRTTVPDDRKSDIGINLEKPSSPDMIHTAPSPLQQRKAYNDQNSEDASKSDDELLEILSGSISSDSDTTPSLDESIYTIPAEAKMKLSSKFGNYSSHFSEHSFPFGGVRDSIDIRKSAMKKYPGSAALTSAKLNLYGGSDLNSIIKTETAEKVPSDQAPSLLKDASKLSEKVVQDRTKKNNPQESDNAEEIPFADEESSQESSERGGKGDRSFTFRTPLKRPLQRPLSMTETRTSSSSPVLAAKNQVLPDTPLTNPEKLTTTPNSVGEAIDDLRLLRTVEREKARQLARERARLKSDEELGLKQIDYKNLRKKYQKSDSVSSDIQEKPGVSEVKVPENEFLDDRSCDKVEVSTTPESVVDSMDMSLPSFEKTTPSVGVPESSSPDSEVFEVCSPVMSLYDQEVAAVSQSSESFEQALKSNSNSDNNTDISTDTTASLSEFTKTNESPDRTAESNNSVDTGVSTTANNSVDTGVSTTASFSEVIQTNNSNSNDTEATSKTECASYMEPELAIEDVELKISPESYDASSSTPSIVNSNSKAKSSSLPGLISRKDKSKSQKTDGPAAVDKSDKSKSKERKSLLSLFANFGKSDSVKNKNKEKDDKEKKKNKSPHSSTSSAPGTESSSHSPTNPLSPLEGVAIKVDGTHKESRFPKLRLARSKEKAKEKRKQKYLMDSQKESSQSPSPPKESSQSPSPPKESSQSPSPLKESSQSPSPPKENTPPLGEVAGISTESAQSPLPFNEGPSKSSELSVELRPEAVQNAGSRSSEITLDRHALIASMASLSKQLPSSAKLQNGVAPQASEDSFSDPEEDSTEKSQASSASGSVKKTKDLTEERKRKYQKLAQRMYRQQEQKRLRQAQEIQRQLEELEVKQRELETRGVEVEKSLRGEGEGSDAHKGEPELMKEWFQLVHDKNVLVRQEQELMVKAKELELEDRHSRLQHELHQRMAIDDVKKTPEQIEEEGNILAEMLEIVEQRDTLIVLLEQNRQRHQEEDRDFELSMQAKGMRFLSFSRS